MILEAPAGRCRPRPRALLALLPILALGLAGPGARAAEEGQDRGVDWLRDWIPGVGVSGGFLTRETSGSIGGGVSDFQVDMFGNVTTVEHGVRTTTTSSITTTCIRGQVTPANNALCEYFGEDTTSMDGFMLSGVGQLLGPALNPLPLRPRLLFHGGYGAPQSSRAVATDGFKPVIFDALQAEPKVRLQLKGDPLSVWWVGGGFALQLPFDRYRTWLKLSAGYSEEEIDVTARIDAQIQTFETRATRDRLKIRSIVPSIGLEAEVARFGPMSVSLSADTNVSIAFDNDEATFRDAAGNSILTSPRAGGNRPGGPIDAFYDPDDISVFGGLSVRVNWVGFER